MKTYFTADPHFGHGNIIKYCHRPFISERERELMAAADAGEIPPHSVKISQESIDRMDNTIINNLNAVVGRHDTLWIVGDVFWGEDSVAFEKARKVRDRINCQNVNVVWGNHDEKVMMRGLFNEAVEQIMIQVDGQYIFMNHYPLRAWQRSHKGSWMLYGHVHGEFFEQDKAGPVMTIDVGVDSHDFKPWSMDELRKLMMPKLAAFHEKAKKIDEGRRPSGRKTGPEVTP